MTTCGEALIDLLEQQGVEAIFGIPGVHTLEPYRGLTHSGIRHIAARHEQGAAFMADGYGRVTGGPGVALVISGPGVTNTATPVAQAYHDSKPLLVLSSVVERAAMGRQTGTIHDLPDQQALMSTITAFSETVTDPDDLPGAIARAWEVFDSRRPRPVHIEIPKDVLQAPCSLPSRPAPRVRASGVDPEAVATAARALAAAERPFLLLGGGASGAREPAIALAERLGAPIGLTINGKGAVPHSHPLCVGATLTFEPVASRLRTADVVLAVGTEFTELDHWALAEPLAFEGTLLRIDIDPEQVLRGHSPEVALVGDARETLSALVAELGGPRRPTTAVEVAALREGLTVSSDIAIHEPLVAALDRALPEDRILAGDSTQPAYAANHLFPVHDERSYLMPIGFGSLGCGLPMAIGAKVALPHRPVACLVGDGGLLFSIAELATAVDLGLSLPVVLWNNGGYGEIRDSMDHAGIPQIATDVSARDFPAIARGFGCLASSTTDVEEVEGLVRDALTASVPTLIELRA